MIDLHRVEAAALPDCLDELATGMVIVDSTGRIVHANISARRMIAEGKVLRATNGRIAAINLQGTAQAGDVAVGKHGIAISLAARSGERYVAHGYL